MNNHPLPRTWCHAALLGAALTLAALAALPASGATAAEGSGHSTTNANVIQVPKSDFKVPNTVAEGRDPFFPHTSRVKTRVTPQPTPTPTPAPVTLALKGVSGTEAKRYALINDKTFEAGEEREIQVGTNRVRVRCIEIREDAVLIEANGTQQLLRLRPGA